MGDSEPDQEQGRGDENRDRNPGERDGDGGHDREPRRAAPVPSLFLEERGPIARTDRGPGGRAHRRTATTRWSRYATRLRSWSRTDQGISSRSATSSRPGTETGC